MALRPIENALPALQSERPKKQAKVAIPVKKQPDPVSHDENQSPIPPPAEATIDYISSEDLKPIEDPEIRIQSLLEGLDSKDWIKVCESLNVARRFALHHSTLLEPILDKVTLVVVKAMKNPRSALCKTAIMVSADFFNSFGEKLLESPIVDAFDNLLLQLLLKSSQDKKFVCEEADKALNAAMVKSIAPLPLLHKLCAFATHSNPRIRARAAISISNCVSRMELEGMKEFGLVKLVQMGVDLLNDRLPDAREAARTMVGSLYACFTEKEEEKVEAWESFCLASLSTIHAQAIIKIVSIR